jgi:hypothetical protein
MPKATINPNDTERHNLRTLPEGFVELRRMSYDAYLQRRDMVTQIKLAGNQGKGRGSGEDNFAGEVSMMNRKVSAFEFKECIVDHNLEDDDGSLLDFSKAHTLKKLHPQVGQEIDKLIEDMNAFATEEEQGN